MPGADSAQVAAAYVELSAERPSAGSRSATAAVRGQRPRYRTQIISFGIASGGHTSRDFDHPSMMDTLSIDWAAKQPFNWKFTAADLTGLLQRLSARHEPANLPQAAWLCRTFGGDGLC